MSDITPIHRPAPAALNGTAKPSRAEQAIDAPARKSDRVELSDNARLLSRLQAPEPVREHLVESVKAQIDLGKYDTEERLDVAVNKLFEELESDGLFKL